MTGDRVKELRKQLSLSVDELSRITGVSDHTIRSYEAGRRNPSRTFIKVLQGYLDNKPSQKVVSNKLRKSIPYYPDIIVTNSNIEMFDQIAKNQTESKMMYDPSLEGADFVLPNYGDSNHPAIRPGDLVGYRKLTVNSFDSLNLDLIYMVVTVNNQRMNKKLQIHKENPDALWAISINNEKYRPFTILKDDIKEVYEVVGVSRRFSN